VAKEKERLERILNIGKKVEICSGKLYDLRKRRQYTQETPEYSRTGERGRKTEKTVLKLGGGLVVEGGEIP